MGLFCVSFHCQTSDASAVAAALSRRGIARQRVVPAQGGWTSLYEERASEQDEERIRELAGGLSRDLGAALVAFLVHDSDIACYWLYDGGKLLDEYNSCPDYFGGDASGDEPSGPSGGQAKVLQRYCRAGVTEDDLSAILAGEAAFAEDVVGQLAEALGIDPQRALTDYRDFAGGDGPDDGDGFDDGGDDDDDDDDDDRGPNLLPYPSDLAGMVAQRLGVQSAPAAIDPRAATLVQAAAAGDTVQIDRLLNEGAAIDAEAPAPLPQGQPAAGLGQLFPGGLPQLAMTPLLAAVIHQQQPAAERLLAGGADPNYVHPLFGTPLHAATGAGNVDLLRLLIDRGGDVTARNRQGQTPLAVVAASRATIERLAQAQAMVKSLGVKLPAILEGLSSATLPTAGWDACERLVQQRGGT